MSLSLDFDSKNTLKVTYLHRVELVYHSASVRFLKSILGRAREYCLVAN